jgi:hypothetical protein
MSYAFSGGSRLLAGISVAGIGFGVSILAGAIGRARCGVTGA